MSGARTALRVCAIGRLTGKPAQGVRLRGLLAGPAGEVGDELFSATTDATGSADVSFLTPPRLSGKHTLRIEAHADGEVVHSTVTIRVAPDVRLEVLPDRARYRPGEQIVAYCFLKHPTADVDAAPLGAAARLQDANGTTWLRRFYRLPPNRLTPLRVPLGVALPPGSYHLEIAAAGQTAQAALEVDGRLPGEPGLDLRLSHPAVASGQQLAGTLLAYSDTGRPLAGRPLRLSVRIDTEGNPELLRWTGRTDHAGWAAFTAWLPETATAARRLHLAASLQDAAGQWHSTQAESALEPIPPRVMVTAPRAPLIAGLPQTLLAWRTRESMEGEPAPSVAPENREAAPLPVSPGAPRLLSVTPEAPECTVNLDSPAGPQTARFPVTESNRVLVYVDGAVKRTGDTLIICLRSRAVDTAIPAGVDILCDGRYVMALTTVLRNGEASLEIELGTDATGLVRVQAYELALAGRECFPDSAFVWVRPADMTGGAAEALTAWVTEGTASAPTEDQTPARARAWAHALLRRALATGIEQPAAAEALLSLMPSHWPFDLLVDTGQQSLLRYHQAGMRWLRSARFNLMYALQGFYRGSGKLPPPSLDASMLVTRRLVKEQYTRDPWGRQLELSFPQGRSLEFELRSLGADGKRDTDDDLRLRCDLFDEAVAAAQDAPPATPQLDASPIGGPRLAAATARTAAEVLSARYPLASLRAARTAWGITGIRPSAAAPRATPAAAALRLDWGMTPAGPLLSLSSSERTKPAFLSGDSVWSPGDSLIWPRSDSAGGPAVSLQPSCVAVSTEGGRTGISALAPGEATVRVAEGAQSIRVLPLNAPTPRWCLQILPAGQDDLPVAAELAAHAGAAKVRVPRSFDALAEEVLARARHWRPSTFHEALAGARLALLLSSRRTRRLDAVALAERSVDVLLAARAGDGGFAVEGAAESGVVATALAVQVLSGVARGVFVDPKVLSEAAQWLLSAESSNGYWTAEPAYLNEARWGALDNPNLPATALAVAALLAVRPPGAKESLELARAYLEAHWDEASSLFGLRTCVAALAALGSKEGANASVFLVHGANRAQGETPQSSALTPSLSGGNTALAETLFRSAATLGRWDPPNAAKVLGHAARMAAAAPQTPALLAASLEALSRARETIDWSAPGLPAATPAGNPSWRQTQGDRSPSLALTHGPRAAVSREALQLGDATRVLVWEWFGGGGADTVAVATHSEARLIRVDANFSRGPEHGDATVSLAIETPPGVDLVAHNLRSLRAAGSLVWAGGTVSRLECVVGAGAQLDQPPLTVWFRPLAEGEVRLRPVLAADLFGHRAHSEPTRLVLHPAQTG